MQGFGGLASWGATPRRAKEYYRTTPANSSPKFCWLNGKAHKASIMEELTYISRMWTNDLNPPNLEIAICTF
jgi:hypothetical protein